MSIYFLLFKVGNYTLASLIEEVKNIEKKNKKLEIRIKENLNICVDEVIDFVLVSLKDIYKIPPFLKKHIKYESICGLINLKDKIIPIIKLDKFYKEMGIWD